MQKQMQIENTYEKLLKSASFCFQPATEVSVQVLDLARFA